MAEKDIVITYESIRYWCLKFGKEFSRKLRGRHTGYGDHWFLDEVFCKINGQTVYLWRAVDQDGQTIDILVQKKRDSKAAKRFLQKLRKQGGQPRLIVTDKLKSYIRPCAQLFPSVIHTRNKGENNRAENSHQATRLRERKMRKFKSIKQAQQFLSNFASIYDFFALIIALSLCGFAMTSAQAGEVIQVNGDTIVYEQTLSKNLGEANGMVIATGYGSMADIRTPIRSEDKFNYINTENANPTNLGQQTDNSAELTVYKDSIYE